MSRILENLKIKLLETCDDFREIAKFDFSVTEESGTCHLTKDQLVEYVCINVKMDVIQSIIERIGSDIDENISKTKEAFSAKE